MTDSGLRRLALALVRHARHALPTARFQWATAMQHEVGHITDDAAAFRWALGCVVASYKEKITAMGLPAVNPGPTVASPDDDPFLWLEELDSPRALAWVEEQNAATLARFASDAGFAADRDALAAIIARPERIPQLNRHRGVLSSFWTDASHPRGVWRTTTLESFRTEKPDWEVVFDLDAVAAAEGEDWALEAILSQEGFPNSSSLIFLSRGGRGVHVMREYDDVSRRFVADGFNLPEARGMSRWIDRDTVLLRSTLGDGMATRSGGARTIRLWRRGTDPLAAPVIFETGIDSIGVEAFVEPDMAQETISFVEFPDSRTAVGWLGDRSGPKTRFDAPSDASVYWHRGWFALRLASPWTVGGETYAPDTVLGTSFEDYQAGKRTFTRLFEPSPRRVVHGLFEAGGFLMLSMLDDLEPVLDAWSFSDGRWTRERLALPERGTASVRRADGGLGPSNGDLFVRIENPLTPTSLYLTGPGRAPQLLKRASSVFDSKGLTITRHEAVSTDGERIPYTQVGPAGETGEAPVLLWGFGGLGRLNLPGYQPSVGKLWLEPGGTHVIAHTRGGFEFGAAWHQAARREGKRQAHDDFAAVAAHLVERGVTRPDRIAAEGEAHAGILMANMLTRYPERFGALLLNVPLIDMRRLRSLGASGVDEYGDPDSPEDWTFMAMLSAYHTAVPGRRYPPVLLSTHRQEANHHPGHARKMAAKLQAMGYEAHFYEPATSGLRHAKEASDRAARVALGYSFLRDAIGWKS